MLWRFDSRGARADTIAVAATVSGGKPPYAYEWNGARSSANDRALYDVPLPGDDKARARLQVKDASGAIASAELALAAPKITMNLIKTSPASNQVHVGETASFAVKLTADGKPVDPKGYTLRWEPNTEAHFTKAEDLGVAANDATFTRLGKVKVWVVALARAGGALATVAESQQIELEVVGRRHRADARANRAADWTGSAHNRQRDARRSRQRRVLLVGIFGRGLAAGADRRPARLFVDPERRQAHRHDCTSQRETARR